AKRMRTPGSEHHLATPADASYLCHGRDREHGCQARTHLATRGSGVGGSSAPASTSICTTCGSPRARCAALLIRQLPVRAPGRVLVLWGAGLDGTDHFPFLYRDAIEYARRTRTLDDVA